MDNTKLKYNLICSIKLKSCSTGFTLIELLIVSLFLGVLAAVALPTFIGQIGKAREVEFINSLGTINRSQQAYHWEKGFFAGTLAEMGVTLEPNYIDNFNITGGGSLNLVSIVLVNNEFSVDQTKAYSSSTFFNAGVYEITACRSFTVLDQIPPPPSINNCLGNQMIQ